MLLYLIRYIKNIFYINRIKGQNLDHTIKGDSMRQSRICLFLFMIIYNYIFLRSIVFPYCYKEFGYNGIWMIIVILVLVIVMFLLIPKKIFDNNYYDNYKKSKIKHFVNALLFLRVILGIFVATITIYDLFLYKYPYLLIPIAFLLVMLIISNLKPKEIIELNTLFSIVILFLYSLYLYDFIDLDFYLMVKEFNLSFNGVFILFSICLLLDNLLILFSNEKNDKPKKLVMIGGISFAIISVLFEYILLVLSAGDYIFLNEKYIGYLTLMIEPVSRYNGNFDYIYILFLGIGAIFKFSYILSVVKNSLSFKFNIKNKAIAFLIMLFLCFIFFILREFINIYFIIISILLVLGLSLLIFILKECYHAKKA